MLGLLKTGKLRLRRTIDQGDLIKLMVRQVRPDHEEMLLDGTVQSVRYGETLRDRSRRPGNINSQEVANSQNFIMRSDATEFVNRVNVEVRKKTEKNVERCRLRGRTFYNLAFVAVTMESATFMVKNFQDNQNPIVNTADLTLKQMFGISAKLVAEQDEMSNLEAIRSQLLKATEILTESMESRLNSSGTSSQDSIQSQRSTEQIR